MHPAKDAWKKEIYKLITGKYVDKFGWWLNYENKYMFEVHIYAEYFNDFMNEFREIIKKYDPYFNFSDAFSDGWNISFEYLSHNNIVIEDFTNLLEFVCDEEIEEMVFSLEEIFPKDDYKIDTLI